MRRLSYLVLVQKLSKSDAKQKTEEYWGNIGFGLTKAESMREIGSVLAKPVGSKICLNVNDKRFSFAMMSTFFNYMNAVHSKIYDVYYEYSDGSKESIFIVDRALVSSLISRFFLRYLSFGTSEDLRDIVFSNEWLKVEDIDAATIFINKQTYAIKVITTKDRVAIVGNATYLFNQAGIGISMKNIDTRLVTSAFKMFGGNLASQTVVYDYKDLDFRHLSSFNYIFDNVGNTDFDLSGWRVNKNAINCCPILGKVTSVVPPKDMYLDKEGYLFFRESIK